MSTRQEYWKGHLSAIEAEGISTKAYAQREGLSVASLYYWRKRMKSASGAARESVGSFVAVQVDGGSGQRVACTLVLGPGVRLEPAR